MYKLSGDAFEFHCSQLTSIYCTSLQEGFPWNSDCYTCSSHSKTPMWHGTDCHLRYKVIVTTMAITDRIFHSAHKLFLEAEGMLWFYRHVIFYCLFPIFCCSVSVY